MKTDVIREPRGYLQKLAEGSVSSVTLFSFKKVSNVMKIFREWVIREDMVVVYFGNCPDHEGTRHMLTTVIIGSVKCRIFPLHKRHRREDREDSGVTEVSYENLKCIACRRK